MLTLGRAKWLLCASMLGIALHSHASQLLSFEGRASDPDTSALLYIENHQVIINDAGDYLSASVTYSTPDGEVFAEKFLDYAKSHLMPDMRFYDKRSRELTTVVLNNSDGSFQVTIVSDNQKQESTVSLDEPLVVVDAGFDRLIASKWQTLQKQQELNFTFLAITRAQLINFQVIPREENDLFIKVELHPRNFFINLLVEPIILEYDQKTKRLLSFEGLSNIERFKKGKRTQENYLARIKYSYEPIKVFAMDSSDALDLLSGSAVKSALKIGSE